MSKLEKGLKEWVSEGFINQEQADRINAFESSKPENSWILSGLLILGAIIIGIGVISLIAANWYQIPNSIKIATDFILLSAVAFWTLKTWESKKNVQFEVLLLFFMLLCLASIGLISQIYHTGGKLYQALMFWSLITFPVALAARQLFVPFLWTTGFLIGLVFTALDSIALQSIFLKNYQAVFMTVPLLCAGLSMVSKSLAGDVGSTRAFQAWTILSGLAALDIAELYKFFGGYFYSGLNSYIPGYIFAALTAFAILQSNEYRKIQKILLLGVLSCFLTLFHLHLLDITASIIFAAFSISALGLMSIFLASIKKRILFQWFLVLLGLRFLALYFQALGGLATTGVGLIISGGIVIGMAVLWNKYRSKLAAWAERWAQ
jgi:uncharacterized membrane protein